jgi:hypothetical protein
MQVKDLLINAPSLDGDELLVVLYSDIAWNNGLSL